MHRPKLPIAIAWSATAALSPAALAQSFYTTTLPPPQAEPGVAPSGVQLRALSMMFVEVPEPREFKLHDLITIIIDETSKSESSQSLDTKKDYELSGAINSFPDLEALLEGRLQTNERSPIVELDVEGEQDFKSEGEAEREDRFVARITAEIIDVKPNGTLVLEASKSVAHGRELKTIVLSGTCREEDVTNANTITSSQLAGLSIVQTTEGEVNKAATKGLIPRVLETIFNF
jgi:flagellar L-ring protein precursor FlgH